MKLGILRTSGLDGSPFSFPPAALEPVASPPIEFQMGRARLVARGTTLKSTALARP
jgi:hypothetical protein